MQGTRLVTVTTEWFDPAPLPWGVLSPTTRSRYENTDAFRNSCPPLLYSRRQTEPPWGTRGVIPKEVYTRRLSESEGSSRVDARRIASDRKAPARVSRLELEMTAKRFTGLTEPLRVGVSTFVRTASWDEWTKRPSMCVADGGD